MKICNKEDCRSKGEPQEISNFRPKNKNGKTYYNNSCNNCENTRIYAVKHKLTIEEAREKQDEYRRVAEEKRNAPPKPRVYKQRPRGEQRSCLVCGEEIPRGTRRTACEGECSKAHRRKLDRERIKAKRESSKKTYKKKCQNPECEKTFKTEIELKKYCDRDCMKKANYLRNYPKKPKKKSVPKKREYKRKEPELCKCGCKRKCSSATKKYFSEKCKKPKKKVVIKKQYTLKEKPKMKVKAKKRVPVALIGIDENMEIDDEVKPEVIETVEKISQTRQLSSIEEDAIQRYIKEKGVTNCDKK